jgi:WD40 repeat protein
LATGKEEFLKYRKYPDYRPEILAVAFSPDGKRLAAVTSWTTVCFWEVATANLLFELSGHTSGISSIAFSPDGENLASGSGDNTVRLWRVGTGQELACVRRYEGGVNSVAFSPDSAILASGNEHGVVCLWEAGTGKELLKLDGHRGGILSVTFSPDGRKIASGSSDGTTLIWRLDPDVTFDEKDLETLWRDIGGEDAPKAYRATWSLVAGGGKSIAFLNNRIQRLLDPQRARRLIVDLDDDDPSVREKASAELAESGNEDVLRKALEGNPSPEVRARVESLLKDTQYPKARGALRLTRVVQICERIDTIDARKVLESIGTRNAKAALERLKAADKRSK